MIKLFTLYGADFKGTLRLTYGGGGSLAELILPNGRRRGDALRGVYPDGTGEFEKSGASSFRSMRTDAPLALFLYDGDRLYARAGDRRLDPGAPAVKPPFADGKLRSGAATAVAAAPQADSIQQTDKPTAVAAAPPTDAIRRAGEADLAQAPLNDSIRRAGEAGIARSQTADALHSAKSEAGRAIAAKAQELFRTDAAPLKPQTVENPFPKAFPNMVWRQSVLPDGARCLAGEDCERTVLAVRSRPAPRPPRTLQTFTRALRSRDGGFWWAEITFNKRK